MSSFGLWRPPGADFWGAPTPGSLARASVTGMLFWRLVQMSVTHQPTTRKEITKH